ncbi:MAG TPA: hypothetical protein VGJ57_04345 [Nitrospirales bacterium]
MGIITFTAISLLMLFTPSQGLELDPVAEAKRIETGMARLCGVWDWTVHSHTLHHREAKSKIVLPTAESAGVEGPSPAEIRIYGDAVYLRWSYPGGYQEDSLLLNDNKRLEGTFRTSTGAVGAVNGKRLSSCRQTKTEPTKPEAAPTEAKP